MAQSLANKNRLLEKYVEVVRQDGLNTNKNVNIGINGSTPNLWVAGNVSIGGTLTTTGTGMEGAQVITAASANALAVGANGTTNPVFNVDTSTASVATGVNIKGAAAAGGVAVSTLSSGTNENLTLDAKGSGTLGINTTSTTAGLVTIGNSTANGGLTVNGTLTSGADVTVSSSANALVVGQAGATNPAFNVDSSTASSATGVNIKSAAAGAGVTLSAISSAASESLTIAAKGATGSMVFQATNGFSFNSATTIQSPSTTALAVGRSGATNPIFAVDDSTGSAVAGLNLKGAVTGGTVALTTVDTGSNTSLTIASKGTGTITFNPAVVATAGGASNDGIQFGSLGVGLFTGTGTPTFSAMNGSIYVDSNATTTTTRMYVNKSGAGTAGTTWTNLTTAA